jgi:curved DNA-binding protein CbpA
VQENAPWEVIKSAHKALARLYHPDRPKGDTRKMQTINDAFDRVKAARGES